VVIAALSIEAIITAPTIEAVMKVTAGEGLVSICSDALDRDRPGQIPHSWRQKRSRSDRPLSLR
jgi:hypothetical protein